MQFLHPHFSGSQANHPFSVFDLATVKLGDKWGFIDSTGSYVINPRIENTVPFFKDDGYAVVKILGQWGVVDINGEFLIEPTFDRLSW